MEDEIVKRNTDCVYFLASPLTCKKGSECEYRHSETARHNPRDCWYWLSGNCLNPTCAFRHPPLEGFTETPPDSVHLTSVVPASKANVHCYFFFNSFCIKGDQCPFLHGDDIFQAQKVSKTAYEVISAQPQERKISNGSDTGPASLEAPPNPSEGTSKEPINHNVCEDLPESTVPDNILEEHSPSIEVSIPECEEPAVKSSDNPGSAGEYIDSRADVSSDQSSEEHVKDHTDHEEWWESSPGFDVLVDDGSEQLAYEDDNDYLLVRERESERLHRHLLQYDYEGSAGYDPMEYPDIGYFHDNGLYESYDHFDGRYDTDHVQRISEDSRERMLEPGISRRRLRREHEVEHQDGVDLHHCLRKRQRTGCRRSPHSSRRRHLSRTRSSSQERITKPGGNFPYGRLHSDVRINMNGSARGRAETTFNENHRQGRVGHMERNRHVSRQRERESRIRMMQVRRPFRSSGVVKKLASEERETRHATGFTGPKTLAQIKEEKVRAKGKGNVLENPTSHSRRRAASTDFQGPKPLSEILKGKRKYFPTSKEMNGSSSRCEGNELAGCQTDKCDVYGYLNENARVAHSGCENRSLGADDAKYDDEYEYDYDEDFDAELAGEYP